MALNESERTIAEAIKNMLDDTALGVNAHKDSEDERANTFTFLHEEIEQAYRLATISLEHHDSICSAFSKIHSYKYLNDPSFALSFKGELASRGVPLEECTKALETVGKMIDKHLKNSNERDAGWNPDLDEIIKASQPPQIEESIDKLPKDNYDHERKFFSDSKVRKWINKQEAFWESVRKRINPALEQLGFKCDTPKEFWEAYDDNAAEYLVRNRMHELFEDAEAQYQTTK